jgi:hypothetical protein
MKRIATIIGILLLLISHTSIAQQDTALHLLKTYNTDIANIAVDNLDNVYILSSTDQLKKFGANGDSLSVYNNVKKYGKLYSVDVTNPLKVLLLYKDFSTVVILDRLLAVRTAIDLRKRNILQISAIGLSYDNNIWLFDSYNNKLLKIDDEGNTLLETPDFRSLFNTSFLPNQIIDQNGSVDLYDSTKGLYIFDYYGTFKKKLPILNWKDLRVNNNLVYGIANNAINVYNTTTYLQYQRKLPGTFTMYDRFIFSNNKLYTTGKNLVNIYLYPF